jgi:hypothetical protein
MLTNCEFDLRRSLSCRRKGSAGRTGRVLASPPSRPSQCLPQHGAVSTEAKEGRCEVERLAISSGGGRSLLLNERLRLRMW